MDSSDFLRKTLAQALDANAREFSKRLREAPQPYIDELWGDGTAPEAVWRQVENGEIFLLRCPTPALDEPFYGAILYPNWPPPSTDRGKTYPPPPTPRVLFLKNRAAGPTVMEVAAETLVVLPRLQASNHEESSFLAACQSLFYDWISNEPECEIRPELLETFLGTQQRSRQWTSIEACCHAAHWVDSQQSSLEPRLVTSLKFPWWSSKRKPESWPYFAGLLVGAFAWRLSSGQAQRAPEITLSTLANRPKGDAIRWYQERQVSPPSLKEQASQLLTFLGRKPDPKTIDEIAHLLEAPHARLVSVASEIELVDGYQTLALARRHLQAARRQGQ